jgi:hypothetical protein
VTVFVCTACGAALTPELAPLPGPLVRPVYEHRGPGPSTVPRGHFAVDPEPFGAPLVPAPDDECPAALPGLCVVIDDSFVMSAGPRDTVVIHPDDAVSLENHPDGSRVGGCCGLFPREGQPNLVCACGAEVATLMADCYAAHELHLDPVASRPAS